MKRTVVFLAFLLALLLFGAPAESATWTYVQESTITYCANNTSSCSNFAGTMIPTLSNSVWMFEISTTNDVTVTVSGGGATWTECASCTTFLSGFRRNRVVYAFGGTGGSTNFSITLSGNSGSAFAVTFVEVLPPAGTTASFDVGGATSSNSCSGTCTGVGLTLTGTDAVFEFLNRTAPLNWHSWSAPFQTIPQGDGMALNVASGAMSAPTVSVISGSGAVFSAIAFKSSSGAFTPPSAGPISIVNFSDTDSTNGTSGLSCTPGCAGFTVAATTVGNLLYLEAANVSGTFISSVSGGGTWVVPASCAIKGGQSTNNAISCAYVLAASSSVTSLTVTMTGNGNTLMALYEVNTTTGQFFFDTAGTQTNTASFNPSGVSLSLTSVANAVDIVIQSASVFGGTSSLSYYPYVRGCQSGCGPQFYNGQAAADAVLNVTSSTFQTPQWANQQNNATVVSGVAFYQSTIINAADCTAGSVQAGLNLVAADGMIVNVPACSLTNWTGTGPAVNYTQVYSTTLQGQGNVLTSDSNGNPATYNDQTQICDLVSNQSNETLRVTTASGKTFRMTGFSFETGCSQSTNRNTGVINIKGSGHSTRVDHNHLTAVVGPRMLNIASGDVFGVIDHNLFDEATAITVNYVEVNGANYNASGDSFGDASWTDVANWGTSSFIFEENNSFISTVTTGTRSIDVQQGGRAVFRYNTNKNSSLQEHAVGHDGPTYRDRGPRALETYKNNFSWPNGGAPFAFTMDYEGGSSLWWGNTIASGAYQTFINLDYRRATGFTYAQVAVPNGWGYCGTSQTGPNGPGPSAWDESRDATGKKCLDGTGIGKGDNLTGTTWPNVNNSVTSTQTWLRQALDPMYVFGGSSLCAGCTTYVGTSQSDPVVKNEHYYVELPNINDSSTFNGTVGIGSGTLLPTNPSAYTNAPACTNGVGYWDTATNTLYQCQGNWGPMDMWVPIPHATLGNTVDTASTVSGAIGSAPSCSLNPATPTGYTFALTRGNMGGKLTVSSTVYPYGVATEAFALDDTKNFTYQTCNVSSGQKIVVGNGFVTPGAANAGGSGQNWDQVILTSADSSAAVVMQLNNGAGSNSCYCYYVETNGGSGFIGRSTSSITVTPGNRYAFSLLFDETNGTAKLAMFDPTNNFAQVGSTITQTQETGQNFSGIRFGNAETGTSTGTTYLEDLMLDWTNHTFPNSPATSWVSYYTPYTYPHPLVGAGPPAPPTGLYVVSTALNPPYQGIANWIISTTPGATYNIYRTMSINNTYVCPTVGVYPLYATGLSGPPFTDNSLGMGVWCYEVTAVANSQESAFAGPYPVAVPSGAFVY